MARMRPAPAVTRRSATSRPPIEVRPRVRVVRHDDGDPAGRGTPRGVAHEQQLDQVLLDRGDDRLDEEHVALPAVGHELDFQAVVGEAVGLDPAQLDTEVRTQLPGEFGMGASTEHDDVTVSHTRDPTVEVALPGAGVVGGGWVRRALATVSACPPTSPVTSCPRWPAADT